MTDPAHTTLHTALTQLPDMIGELRGYLEPGKTGSTGRSAPRTTPSAPIQLSPMDDADDLYAALREHAACIADTLGMKPPTTVGRYVNGEKGLPANTPPEIAFNQSLNLTRFIEHHLPMLDDDELRSEIAGDLIRRWGRTDRRYPAQAPKQHMPLRCVSCEVMLVYMHPPRSFGSDETFVCDSCGRWHTEQEIAEQRIKHQRELKAKGGAA